MSLIRWDPFADMEHLRDQVNRLFQQGLVRAGHEPVSAQMWVPAVDVTETENEIVLHVDLAGMKPEEVDVQITGDILTLKGERKMEKEEKGKQFVRVERRYGAFQRSFTIGVPIDAENVRAAYHEGVLEVTLPKIEEAKPKQIKVEVK